MRVIVCGSRDWMNPRAIYRALHNLVVVPNWKKGYDGRGVFVDYLPPKDFVLVTGACPTGADAMARDWMIGWDQMPEEHPADWEQFGKGAGFARNAEMVRLGADLCLGFLMPCSKADCKAKRQPGGHWSHGSMHTMRLADEAGIDTLRIYGGAA